jgi:tRNA threonylcarbamoyladenosine biosynthesis protein TsaE
MIESAAESLDIALPDLAATERLAQALAARAGVGDIVALWGGLGAGKTTFARAFIHARPGGAGVTEVPSPTFTLVQVYDLAGAPIWHFDLYRLANAEDAWELGIEEAFTEAISLIEWPDRLGALLPAQRLDLHLSAAANPDARQARLVGHGDWSTRLESLRPHA